MTVNGTAQLPVKLEPVPPQRSVWRRALPWIVAFAGPALGAGVGAAYLVDAATLHPIPAVAPLAIPVESAPVTVLPALSATVPTVVPSRVRLVPRAVVSAVPPVALVRSVTPTPGPSPTVAPTTAATSSTPTTAPSTAPTATTEPTETPGNPEGPATPEG